MISVLTITYKRHHLLEEAIESFLRQESRNDKNEMVIINDNPEVDYVYEHSQIRIINHKQRFPSISSKIEWGYKICNNPYIYRLDDDDLLAPWALINVESDIINNPGYDIYRSSGMYFFLNNQIQSESDNVNNGNVYSKNYLDRIEFPDLSGTEDANITFHHNAKIYRSNLLHTMIYRWGMNTFHISGMGTQPNNVILEQADRVLDNRKGTIQLDPKFIEDYYGQLNKYISK